MKGLRPRERVALLAFVLVQFALPLARVDSRRGYPFSGRFSWSMFAGPLTAGCSHELSFTDREGRTVELPLPSRNDPVGGVLRADAPVDFAAVAAPRLYAYADDDPTLAASLDAFLRRWWGTRPERGVYSLRSELRCETPGQRPFARTLTLRPDGAAR